MSRSNYLELLGFCLILILPIKIYYKPMKNACRKMLSIHEMIMCL